MWTSIRPLILLLLICHSRSLRTLNISYKENGQLYEGNRCRSTNGSEGVCVKAIHCQERIEQIQKGDYSVSGRCGFQGGDEIFCCAPKLAGGFDVRGAGRAAEACRERNISLTKGTSGTSVDGLSTEPGEFPYMAAIGYSAPAGAEGPTKRVCGGTLISRSHVLTAAHCVSDVQEFHPRRVLLGTNDLDETRHPARAQSVPISRIILHPEFKRGFNYHDLAILVLRDPVELTIDVQPACLATKPLTGASLDVARDSLVVLGWGGAGGAGGVPPDSSDSPDGGTSAKLIKAQHLKFVNKKRCCKRYADVRANIPNGLDDAMICVRNPDTAPRADACWGDSGGPLLVLSAPSPILIGVASFGQACGANAPGVYVSVYKYLQWIQDQVWPNSTGA